MKKLIRILSAYVAFGIMLSLPGIAAAETYTYDAAGRLTGATYDDGTSITYTYDSSGNKLQQQVTAPDTTPPNAPSVSGTTPTSNTAPSWSWAAGGGGNGTFRYKLDNSDLSTGATETTSTTYTPSSALSLAVHTLYVQERDDAANWSASGSFAITIIAANNPPAAFNLVSPADGATGITINPTLSWKKSTDPDGDTISYEITYCVDASFAGCSPITVASISNNAIVMASLGSSLSGLFLLGMFFSGSKPKIKIKKQLALIALAALMVAITACGGGGGGGEGGSGNPITPITDEAQYSAIGLTSATTYYWKVTASDGNGGITESATWSFTTQ